MRDLSQKVVIITGASGNLGVATANAFQDAGSRTVLVDRNFDRLQSKYPQLVDSPNHLLAGDVDVGDPTSVSNLMLRVVDRFGSIDALVNTVGGYRGGKRVDQDDVENWSNLLDLNLRTALNCCRAVVPQLLRQQSGRIINIASRAALAGSGYYCAYSISKSAVLRLTESLSEELKEFGINVNCVLPGTIDTPQNRAAMPDSDFTKWVTTAAIAEVIVFLASFAARGVTGAAVPVFGRG